MVWQQKTKAVVMLNRIVEKESVSNTWYLQLTVQSVIVNLQIFSYFFWDSHSLVLAFNY